MNQKEKWIDEVLQSLDGIMQPQPPAGFQERVVAAAMRSREVRLPGKIVWSLAAGLLLLISLNVFSLAHLGLLQAKNARQQQAHSIATEYFSSVSDN